eukprot:7475956-Alexandrium_andersonii.AAC.1
MARGARIRLPGANGALELANQRVSAAVPAGHTRVATSWRESHGACHVKLFASCPAVPVARQQGAHEWNTQPELPQ